MSKNVQNVASINAKTAQIKKWLWPSARHFKEVTVTLSQVTVTLK